MEKLATAAVSTAGSPLHALVDATNLRPQQQLPFKTSLPFVGSLFQLQQPQSSQRECIDVPDGALPTSSRGAENSENTEPQSSLPAVAGRKRPLALDESQDEPDGQLMVATAQGPQQQQQPLKKRQRPSDVHNSLLMQRLLQQQQQQQPPQSFKSAAAPLTSESVPSTAAASASPINLVKRECSLTLHCIVEFRQRPLQPQLPHQLLHQPPGSSRSAYVSVPSELPVSELTRFVLNDLGIEGVNPGDCLTKLAMPCWKQLAMDEICHDPETVYVGSLLQHVCNFAQLHIQLPMPDSALLASHIIRTLLRSLLPPQVPQAGQAVWLKQIGCPIEQATLEAYLLSPDSFEFSTTDRAIFGDWHSRMCMQYLQQVSKAPPNLLALPLPILPLPIGLQSHGYQQPAAGAEVSTESQLLLQPQPQPQLQLTAATSPSSASSASQRSGRLRICFDAESELPLLQQWFSQNPHPNRDQLSRYRDTLNALPARRDGTRRPLDNANVAYWFKNMRATERRQSSSSSAAASSAAGPSAREAAAVNEFDSESASPHPQVPLRLCVEEGDDQQQQQQQPGLQQLLGVDESIDSGSGVGGSASKRRRTRVFIDPVTEIPQLEIWFDQDSHPSSTQFQVYAQVLNCMPFRQRQPPLEAKNVQLWFKNHRAKVKRERIPDLASDDATAAAAAAAVVTTDDDLDVETTDADVEVDTIDAGADETIENATDGQTSALGLICKTESSD